MKLKIIKMVLKYSSSLLRNVRYLHHQRTSFALTQEKTNLTQAVTDAEKVVGYPTSFLNLRWLLTDELANVAMHIRKLMELDHPLIDTARKMFMGNNSDMPWGLIVLLVSNSCGIRESSSEYDCDSSAGVLYSQRALAEITEMIRTSNILHKNIQNFNKQISDQLMGELNFGNKMALLSGDYLLSKSFHKLALLRNSDLNALISSALRDLVEADFIGNHDEQTLLPSKPVNTQTRVQIVDHFGTEPYEVSTVLGNPIAEWTLRSILGGASLLAKACRGALILARHSEHIQELGFSVGKNIALAWQVKIEREPFLPSQSGKFSLMSAPVMVHLEHVPNSYEKIKSCAQNASNIDYEDIRKEIQSGPGLEGAQRLQQHFSNEAFSALNKLPKSDARLALENIVKTM